MIQWMYKVVNLNDVNLYFNLVLIPIGIVANLIAMYIFGKKNLNKKTNIGYMHSLLCLYNIVPLINSIILTQILPYYKISLPDYSNFACKILNFWRRFAIDLSSIQQVLITVFLYLSVGNPSKFIKLQKWKITSIIIAAIMVFLVLVNVPFLLYEIKSKQELHLSTSNTTVYICYSSVDVFTIAIGISILVRYLVPLIFMLTLNFFIIRHFYNPKLLFLKENKVKKPKHFLVSIVIINFLFFAFYTPWAIFYTTIITSNYIDHKNIIIEYNNILLVFLFNLSLTVSYLNYCSPFFVHILFNRLFRSELLSKCRPLFGLFSIESHKNDSSKETTV